MARYIGLDVHSASCTMVVLGPSGKKLASHVVETNARMLIELIKNVPRPRYLCFEEGTQSTWLYETLSPHLDRTVVTIKSREHAKSKDDERDASELANKLRTDSLQVQVFKDVGSYGRLRSLAAVHQMQVNDSVRVQNRIKALFRSYGLETGNSVYEEQERAVRCKKLPARARTTADLLLRQYDAVESLRQEAEKALVQEARKHPSFKLLTTVPGLGGIRAARLMSVVVSPQRFRTREQFWKYAGFAVVKHSSADWEKNFNGTLYKHKTEQTRGLNRNHNHTLKDVFKGAATSIIAMHRADCPLFAHYTRMLDDKIKPALAQLTIARQIAAITLSLWKKEIAYDPAKLKKLT